MSPPHDWSALPPELLVKIAQHLELSQVCSFSLVCQSWYLAICDNNLFWRHATIKRYRTHKIPVHVLSDPQIDWKSELFRLTNKCPSVNTQTLTGHTDEVLFVSFAHKYGDFVSCSKDRTFIIWRYNDKTHEFEHFNTLNMGRYYWHYTWSGQYSSDDKKLLVSGVIDSLTGEIAIFNTNLTPGSTEKDYTFVCRVVNDPYDVMGCWCTERYYITSCYQVSDNEMAPAMNMTMFICDYKPITPHPMWSHLPEETAQLLSVENCIGRVFDFMNPSAVHYLRLIRIFSQKTHDPSKKFPMELRNQNHGRQILMEDQDVGFECEEVFRKNQLCMVAMFGTKTIVPHKVGFRDLTLDSVICPKRITDFDHSIEFHGQIVSISCTKDDLQMFVAVREWPENAVATRSDPPPISTEVIIHVVDLESWSLTGQIFKGPIGRTSCHDAFYLYSDSSPNYLSCGSEDGRGVLWDRKTGVKLSTLDHEQCLNCVSFRVEDDEVCVTSSDDFTIKVWKSKDRVKREMSETVCDD